MSLQESKAQKGYITQAALDASLADYSIPE
jgi:hypothetical protein